MLSRNAPAAAFSLLLLAAARPSTAVEVRAVEARPPAGAAGAAPSALAALVSALSPQASLLGGGSSAPAMASASAAAPAAPAAPDPAAVPVHAPEAAMLAAFAARLAPGAAAAPEAAVHPASVLLDGARRILASVSARDIQTMPEERLRELAARILEGDAARDDLDAAADPGRGGSPSPLARATAAPARGGREVPPPAPTPGRAWVWPSLVAVVWAAWLAGMTAFGHWGLLAHDWFMSVTMAFGSFVAGATSEGSGSISFPVMTLLFHIKPAVARDFSLMIQSVGMTTAAVTIFARRIPVELRAIGYGMLGGFAGMAVGTSLIAPLFAPPFVKMFFTSLWAAFALAHWRMDRSRGRAVADRIASFGPRDAAALAAFGMAGGVVSSIVGTGLCMVVFTLLTLGYRVSEKVATPTSVVLMASNALFGFLYKELFAGGMAPQAWDYWWVCVPIVVLGAPLGARFIAGRSRRFVSRLLYAAIAVQLAAALLIVPQTWPLAAVSAATFLGGSWVFGWMKRRGDARAGGAR